MQNIVGQNIRQKRLEAGLTQAELARKVGVTSKAAISRVENGVEDLTTDRVRKYAKALECTPAELMGWCVKRESNEDFTNRMMLYLSLLQEAFMKASEKDKKAVCTILDIPYKETKNE